MLDSAQTWIPLAGPSTTHIIVILVVVLILFGGKKLPELAKGLARGMRIFRDEMHGIQRDIDEPPTAAKPTDPAAPPAASPPVASSTTPPPTQKNETKA